MSEYEIGGETARAQEKMSEDRKGRGREIVCGFVGRNIIEN